MEQTIPVFIEEWAKTLLEIQSKIPLKDVEAFLSSKVDTQKTYSKMYVVVKDTINTGHAVNSVGHATISLYLQHEDNPYVKEWVRNSFRKVTDKATEEEFEKAKTFPYEHVVITESMLGGAETVLAFVPRVEWDEFFKTLPLYK